MKTNRSKIVSWFHCPRYRYLKYHFGGNGLQRITQKGPSESGKAIHEGMALLLNGWPVQMAVDAALTKFSLSFPMTIPHADVLLLEQKHFIEGVIRAFNRCRVKELTEEGKIIAIEQEKLVSIGKDFDFQFRADAIKEVQDGIEIIDFKPTANGDFRFVRSWERNHQVLSYVAAAEELYQKPVLGVRIEGYIKGRRRADKRLFDGAFKIQDSPLCYIFVNDHTGVISPEYQRSGDWSKVPLWETGMSSAEYVEEYLSEEQVRSMFLSPVPPIAPHRGRLESWKTQTFANELRIDRDAGYVEKIRVGGNETTFLRVLDERFPQNQDSCWKYGEDFPCEMSDVCFNGEVFASPLESGIYEEREDHHGPDDTTE